MSKLRTDRLRLAIIDDGKKQAGHIPVRRVFLQDEFGGGFSLVLYALDMPAGAAEEVAEWFASVGVEVVRVDKAQSLDEVPAVFHGDTNGSQEGRDAAAGEVLPAEPGAVPRGGDAGGVQG